MCTSPKAGAASEGAGVELYYDWVFDGGLPAAGEEALLLVLCFLGARTSTIARGAPLNAGYTDIADVGVGPKRRNRPVTAARAMKSTGIHPSLHHHPPLTPAAVLLRGRWATPVVAVAFLALAALGAVDDGAALRGIDEPVTRALLELRSGPLDGVVKAVSALGGLTVVVTVAVLLLLLVWHECRALALTLLAATAVRPLLEWLLKELVSRPRPDIDRLVPGNGPSFPSGHVMAAIAIWGLLPPVVALITGRHAAWWWSVGISGTVIASVAFSRVYLGVHWLTDVVGALLLGALYLLAVEALLEWHHRRRPCGAIDVAEGSTPPHGWRHTDLTEGKAP